MIAIDSFVSNGADVTKIRSGERPKVQDISSPLRPLAKREMILATLVYLRGGGRTLMLHRVKKPGDMHWGKWNGLGGKVKPGETPEECAVREVREESGLTIESPRLRGFITFPAFDQYDDWYVFVFTAEKFCGQLIDSAEGRLEWIEDQSLTSLDLWEGDRIFLPWLDQERIFSAKICYDQGRLSGHQVVFY